MPIFDPHPKGVVAGGFTPLERDAERGADGLGAFGPSSTRCPSISTVCACANETSSISVPGSRSKRQQNLKIMDAASIVHARDTQSLNQRCRFRQAGRLNCWICRGKKAYFKDTGWCHDGVTSSFLRWV